MNRFWIRLEGEEKERIWGGGEQMSYFDLSGRRFPLWTSEPGVGRDKRSEITFKADAVKAGGDYYHTNYPQPSFISSRRYFAHFETTAYSVFDFRRKGKPEIEIWEVPKRIEFVSKPNFVELVEHISLKFGRQPPLPDWIYNGAIIGLKDGENSLLRLQKIRDAGVKVSALWCEDWVGLRNTSFGARLFWDWKNNEDRYPNLEEKIRELEKEGIRFMGYVNPYLCNDGELYQEALSDGYFALNGSGEVYLVDFGEFHCGVVDFTNPEAFRWFKERIIGQNMLDFGLSGWMADFGEYLPTDVKLFSGEDAKMMHNAWPTIWAQVNSEAVEERGKRGDALFFMRAGFTGVHKYCPLLWGGDQSVDFSRHDGLVTVICGALSSGILGNAYHHSDIGGYTSLFGNVRTPELIMRWAEMAAFTAVMRTHEGNRPKENIQIDQDETVLTHFARMTRIYVHMAPYLKEASKEAVERGLPVQRPLFIHYEGDETTFDIQDQYLFGRDVLVAPVWKAGINEWELYLPVGDKWIGLWNGDLYEGGQRIKVGAPIGKPPVFYREASSFKNLFEGIKNL
eukprot:TRINITY_DN4729_c0_g1_i2.p1 TRINITY_DN4729_c0_g1~~TRINITY_DN4729_c0_g1_i2.p1  ORF type:complete len:567 (+),score=183.14 TRINITY_DN4729_c0_g1_i2:379-2079(+)